MFNVFGLIFIVLIMVPNIIYAIKCKYGFNNKWNNKHKYSSNSIIIIDKIF